MLTLKQKVVNLIFNGDSRGLYVVEEVPSVLTVERDSRKNGPIFGLEEDYGVGIGSILDVYDKKSWASDILYEYSRKNLYDQFYSAESGLKFSSALFDMDEWARYFALHDLFGSYHGTVLKSVKFYYNPVLGKFQPILFDSHIGAGNFNSFILIDLLTNPESATCSWICDDNKDFYMGFLRNEDFLKFYLDYLEVFSSEQFLDEIYSIYNNDYRWLDNEFYSRFSSSDAIFYQGMGLYLFKPNNIKSRSNLINNKLFKISERGGIDFYVKDSSKEQIHLGTVVAKDNNVKIITLGNFSSTGTELTFNEPSLVILNGSTTLRGLSKIDPLVISGPVMFVQNGGEFEADYVHFKNTTAIPLVNRNWSGSVNILYSEVKIGNMKISGSMAEDALNIVSSNFSINDLHISTSRSDALDLDFSNGKIKNIYCNDIGNDCLDTSESIVNVKFVSAIGTKDKAVSAGENSQLNISEINIIDSGIGLVAKDGSFLAVEAISYDNVDLSMASFNKKPQYTNPIINIGKIIKGDIEFLGLISTDSISKLPSDLNIETKTSVEIEGLMYGAVFGEKTVKQ